MKDIQWVGELPRCDLCKILSLEAEAPYDGPTRGGPWANMCHNHLVLFGSSDMLTTRRIVAKVEGT